MDSSTDRLSTAMECTHEFSIDRSIKIIRQSFAGRVTTGDIIKGFRSFLESPDFEPFFRILTDLREAELLMEPAEVKDIDAFVTGKVKGRSAIVAATPHQTALVRLYIIHRNPKRPVELFSTIDAAMAFLGPDL